MLERWMKSAENEPPWANTATGRPVMPDPVDPSTQNTRRDANLAYFFAHSPTRTTAAPKTIHRYSSPIEQPRRISKQNVKPPQLRTWPLTSTLHAPMKSKTTTFTSTFFVADSERSVVPFPPHNFSSSPEPQHSYDVDLVSPLAESSPPQQGLYTFPAVPDTPLEDSQTRKWHGLRLSTSRHNHLMRNFLRYRVLIWRRNPCQNMFHTYSISWNQTAKTWFYLDFHERNRRSHLGLNLSRGHSSRPIMITPFSLARDCSSVGVCDYPPKVVLDWESCLGCESRASLTVPGHHRLDRLGTSQCPCGDPAYSPRCGGAWRRAGTSEPLMLLQTTSIYHYDFLLFCPYSLFSDHFCNLVIVGFGFAHVYVPSASLFSSHIITDMYNVNLAVLSEKNIRIDTVNKIM
jgi:hypothetical protein